MNWTDMHDVKLKNRQAGGHWFSPGATRFFDSRFSHEAILADDGRAYFVSSERYSTAAPRLYSVRVQNLDGSIDTVGDFQAYGSSKAAWTAAKRCAKGSEPSCSAMVRGPLTRRKAQ